MKICIWCTKIFDLGGTKRVVTLLANELVKEHDVTIMVYQDRFKEDRNMYHMSEDIKVDFIDNNEFVNRHHTPAFCWRYLVQKLNAKYGIFNKEKYNDILADAIFPKKTREKWVKYLKICFLTGKRLLLSLLCCLCRRGVICRFRLTHRILSMWVFRTAVLNILCLRNLQRVSLKRHSLL